jgi:hypothetical protein
MDDPLQAILSNRGVAQIPMESDYFVSHGEGSECLVLFRWVKFAQRAAANGTRSLVGQGRRALHIYALDRIGTARLQLSWCRFGSGLRDLAIQAATHVFLYASYQNFQCLGICFELSLPPSAVTL